MIPSYTIFTREGVYLHFGFSSSQNTTVLTGERSPRPGTSVSKAIAPDAFVQHIRKRSVNGRHVLPLVKLCGWPDGMRHLDLASKIDQFHEIGKKGVEQIQINIERTIQAVSENMGKLKPTFDHQADAALTETSRKVLKIDPTIHGKVTAESDEASIAMLVARGKTEEEARAFLGIDKPKPGQQKKK